MLKVQILDRCNYCDGQAYLPLGEADNWKGETYLTYAKCPMCDGTGERARWISLPEFLLLLKDARCKHEHTSQRGGFHFEAGEVWDDVEEICDDCSAVLSSADPLELFLGPNSK